MKREFLKKIKKIHFIGIGGVGVSAIARMARLHKIKVSGSDMCMGPMIERIKDINGKIVIGHKKENLSKHVDLVIYSPAIPENNPELVLAKKLNIPTYSYPQALGLISQDKYTIAVSGTHGKTTTTCMIGEIMIYANQDPTIVVGGLLKKQKDNFVLGESKYFVVEACEYKESFLSLCPDILVITNIDNDHLDYYKNIENIQNAFAKLISKTKDFVVCDLNDKNIQKALSRSSRQASKAKIIDYSKQKIDFDLSVPGKHNIQNAKASLAVAKLIGIKPDKAKKILKNYSGTWRRFEYKGKTKKQAFIYDDYAHHPAEVRATLNAAREKFPNKQIIAVFQPHLYSRLKFLLKDFGKSFSKANKVIVTDIYAAREKYDQSIHARDLVKELQKNKTNANYIKNFSDIEKSLKNMNSKNIIITLGAGDVYKVGEGLNLDTHY